MAAETKYYPIYFAPDIDNAWSVAPGALSTMSSYAPLQSGHYGSVGSTTYLTGHTGTDFVSAYMFRNVSGAVRYLVNRATNLDEYDSAGTLTNRGTAYTTTTDWAMCAQGDAVIAVSPDNATQVSTGAGFAALGGGSPRAKLCASNFGFVMLANTDTSKDQVWWSAVYNYASFTPSIASEAGNFRLLEAPGPITALVTFRDGFVAFKNNAMFIAEYTGPNYIWRWRMLSNRIGCVGARAVSEIDGRLVFLHTSGAYAFDGQSISNIGLPVNQTILNSAGYLSKPGMATIGTSYMYDELASCQTIADEIEGVVWFSLQFEIVLNADIRGSWFGYNARSKKWSQGSQPGYTSESVKGHRSWYVHASVADVQTFKKDAAARFLYVQNYSSGPRIAATFSHKYPFATTDDTTFGAVASVRTGIVGSDQGSSRLVKVRWRTIAGSNTDNTMTVSASGYTNENKNITNGIAVGGINTEFDEADLLLSARFFSVSLSQTQGKVTILAGVGIDVQAAGKR